MSSGCTYGTGSSASVANRSAACSPVEPVPALATANGNVGYRMM